MNRIQERIDRIVKHLPDGRVQFMGYVWQEDLIKPVQGFNELNHPTIMQCIEYILGVDLYFIYNEELPPVIYGDQTEYYSFERYAAGRMLHPHEMYLEHFHCKEPKNPYNEPRGEKIEGYTKFDFAEDLRILTGIVLQIYDDITKDIHIGQLPDGKEDTVPKGPFLEWLDGYMPGVNGSGIVEKSIDPNKCAFEKAGDVWQVFYKGKMVPYLFKRNICIEYMLPIIQAPGDEFPYLWLRQFMNNTDDFDSVSYDDELTESSPSHFNDCDIRREDVLTMKDLLEKQYGEYLENPDDGNKWRQVKEYAKVYGLLVQDDSGKLKIIDKSGEKIKPKEHKNARSLIGKHRTSFIALFKEDLPELYDHFNKYLILPHNGTVKYDPPEPAPMWKVKK